MCSTVSESQNSLLRLCGRQKGSHAWAWYVCRFFEKQRSGKKEDLGCKVTHRVVLSHILISSSLPPGVWFRNFMVNSGRCWDYQVSSYILDFCLIKKRRKQLIRLHCANQCGADIKPVKPCSSLIRCKINSRWFIVAYCDDKKFPCEALRHWVTLRNFHLR